MREKKLFQIGLILPVITFVIMTKIFDMSHPGKMALLSGLFLFQFIVVYKGRKFVDRARIVILSIFFICVSWYYVLADIQRLKIQKK